MNMSTVVNIHLLSVVEASCTTQIHVFEFTKLQLSVPVNSEVSLEAAIGFCEMTDEKIFRYLWNSIQDAFHQDYKCELAPFMTQDQGL